MGSPNVFDRVDDEPDDAVIVRIWQLDDQTVAEAAWRPRAIGGSIIGPALGNPVEVPRAINRAIDACQKYGFKRIVVQIEDESLWDPKWGTLRSGR